MATEVKSHISGSVWKLERAVGDSIESGDVVLIVESMKMEVPIEAPAAGRLAEIRVEVGQRLEEDEVVALIE